MYCISIILFLFRPSSFLHVLECVDPPLGVALPHLAEGLELVPSLKIKNNYVKFPKKIIISSNLCQVFPVEPVLRRLLRHLVSQVGAELLKMSKFKLFIYFFIFFCAKMP